MLPFRKPGSFDRGKGSGKGMGLTASEAAREVGKSLPTITKAIQSGKLSAIGPKGGPYSIEPVELFRVWPRVASKVEETPQLRPEETPSNPSPLQGEVELLEERLRSAQALNERLVDEVQDLRARLDAEAEERWKLVALVTHQAEKPAPVEVAPLPRRRFLWWSIGPAARAS